MVPVPTEPVSQVVFVHDYFQVVFHDDCFSFYGPVEVSSDDREVTQGRPGFCDALVALIGERATSAIVGDDGELTIAFSSGAGLRARPGPPDVGPEAWLFNGPSGQIVGSSCC